jgi:hypothetical protein
MIYAAAEFHDSFRKPVSRTTAGFVARTYRVLLPAHAVANLVTKTGAAATLVWEIWPVDDSHVLVFAPVDWQQEIARSLDEAKFLAKFRR